MYSITGDKQEGTTIAKILNLLHVKYQFYRICLSPPDMYMVIYFPRSKDAVQFHALFAHMISEVE